VGAGRAAAPGAGTALALPPETGTEGARAGIGQNDAARQFRPPNGEKPGYTSVVSRVADILRAENLERLRRMTPAERLAEALALGDATIDAYAAAHGLGREEARSRLEQASQAGRLFSRVMSQIVA
jgi:hypothetical protein